MADLRTFGQKGRSGETVGAFNADIPLPENDGIIGDKRKAYEQAQVEKKQADKVRSLQDFAFAADNGTDEVEMELPDSEPEREPFEGLFGFVTGKGRELFDSCLPGHQPTTRHVLRNAEGGRGKGRTETSGGRTDARLDAQQGQAGGIDEQVA